MKKLSFLSILVGICLVLAACQAATPLPPTATPVPPTATDAPPTATAAPPTATAVPPSATPEPEPVLEVVGPDGAIKALTLDEIQALSASEGQAGIKSSTGKITLPSLYKGVSLQALADVMGGLDESMGVNVVAEDGYGITFSYDQIMNGTFIAYDPATGDERKAAVPLTAILAYEHEGQMLDSKQDGALRLAIISSENNQVTDGHWSVKWVTRIEIKPLVQDWTLSLKGAQELVIDRASFESCANCHRAAWTDDKAQEWVGVPLWLLLGYADDETKHDGPAFNDALAAVNYNFEVTAADGYTVTLESARSARNDNLIVAYLVNGNPLPDKYFPLRLVGSEAQKNEQVGQIAEIVLHLENVILPTPEPTAAEPAAAATVPAPEGEADLTLAGLVNKGLSLTEASLRALEVVQITAEHPKKGAQNYEGVRLNDLLEQAGIQDGATKIIFTAGDGFSAEASLAEVRNCADCLVAFSNTPGDFSMVMPGFASNVWVKGVVSIEVK